MSDFVKRMRDGCNLQQRDGERAADRIEQLERELSESREREISFFEANEGLGESCRAAHAELAAEKALADRLAEQLQGWWDCSDTFPWRDHEDREALAAYRKARGM